jgi:uncharacterized protein
MVTPSCRLRKLSNQRSAPRPGFAPRLVIMVKEPVAGRVKTRLARGIGTVAATAAYRRMLSSLVARLGHDRRWETVLAVSPDGALASSMLPDITTRVPQGGGDLGKRMQAVFDAMPPGPVIVIGTDIPGIRPADIARAFRCLGAHDAVLGPSGDGGFWLVGLNRRGRFAKAFANVRWSSAFALSDTRKNLKNYCVALTATKDDIDSADDLRRLGAKAGRVITTSRG